MSELVTSLGTALGDRYDVLRQIGEGAHGVVFLARDLRHDRRVAIKVLRVDGLSSDGLELRFLREIQLLARLQHPNILPLHDSGHFGSCLYYVMPYVQGETLRERIHRERRLSILDASAIARELADALECAHAAGVVHRDVKPENVLLASGRPLLADFGVAAALYVPEERRITKTGDLPPGTPAYMSPEQLIGDGPVDGRADLYAVGCVLYEMLAGVVPFAGSGGFAKRFVEPPPSLRGIRSEVPQWLDDVVHRALQRDPDSRFSNARELRSALSGGSGTGTIRRQRPRARVTSRASRLLPAPLAPGIEATPFVGRDNEITSLVRLLDEHRLVTLLGQGGVGKTRLAKHVAALIAGRHRHGVRTVSFDGIPTTALMWATIGEAIGVSHSAHGDARTRVFTALRRRSILLVLDGFEHFVAMGREVLELLARAPGLRVLVTSRERINVSAEVVLELAGLPTQLGEAAGAPARDDALQLFAERARHVVPGFELNETLLPAVAQLCQLVDGLPLAIELAASMLRILDCHEIVAELLKNYDILSTDLRDVPERHRNLRAVFEQSWRLLPPAEQDALMRLSVFAAGFSRDAATAIGNTSLGVLRALSDKSLLQHIGSDRYKLHSVIRQHAHKHLSPAARLSIAEAHARYYGIFVRSRASLLTGRDQGSAATEMVRELPELRAGWHHAAAVGDERLLECYIDGLYQLYLLRSWFREGAAEFWVAIDTTRSSVTSARLLARQGKFLFRLGEISAARDLLARSLRMLRQLDARRDMLLPLRTVAVLSTVLGKYGAAERLLRTAVRMCKQVGDRHELGIALVDLAYAITPQGRAIEVESLLREGMVLLESMGDESATSVAATSLGALLLEERRFDEAREILNRALQSSRAIGNERIVASALLNLGALASQTGDPDRGAQLCRESLAAFREMGNEEGVAASHMFLGELELSRNGLEAARGHFLDALRAAKSLGAEIHVVPVLLGLAELFIKTSNLSLAREIIASVLASKSTAGRFRAKAESLTLALADVHPHAQGQSAPRSVNGLVHLLLSDPPDHAG